MAALSPILNIPAFDPVNPLKALIQSMDPTGINLGDATSLLPLAEDIVNNINSPEVSTQGAPSPSGSTSTNSSGGFQISPGSVISAANKGLPMLSDLLGFNFDSLGGVGISPFFGDSAYEAAAAAGLGEGAGDIFAGINPGAIMVALPKITDLIVSLTGGRAINPSWSAVRGSTPEGIQSLLSPVLNDMGDPVPLSEGENTGAVQGELNALDDIYPRQISRFRNPNGEGLSYDLGFQLANQGSPVAGGIQDTAMRIFDQLLKQKGQSLAPDAAFNIGSEPEPSRKGYGFHIEFPDGGEAINAPDVDTTLYLLYNNLKEKGLLV